jgi:hypothetical protein
MAEDLQTEFLETTTKATPEESIAQSLIPYNLDDDRARYLGLRSSGFTIREALKLIGKAHSTLSYWRLDAEFVSIEARLPELRKQLSLEYANLEFLRNYRLVLEKDYRILKLSLEPEYAEIDGKKVQLPLSRQEHEYLLKMRSHYTPQQLQIIEALLGIGKATDGFDFTRMILEISRTDTIKVQSRDRSRTSELHKLQPTDAPVG